MPTPIKKEHLLLGAIIVMFCFYVPFHAGGESYFCAFAIAAGCIIGVARAVMRYRNDNKPFTRKIVWRNAAAGSWIVSFVVGLFLGGPYLAGFGFGYALAMGSAAAWGFTLIAFELFQDGVETKSSLGVEANTL